MISKELEAQIVRLFEVEQWRIGTIGKHLQVHHTVVERVLRQNGLPPQPLARPSLLDPFLPFVQETLAKYPTLPLTRMYVMCKERGYSGRIDHFRHRIAPLRPRPAAEAYLRLRTLPGEQGQVDWAHFDKVVIGRASRALMAFVMVLSYSRRIFLQFFLGAHFENFLRGHVGAFHCFGGISKVLLYDNLKSAVTERVGDAIRFHARFLDFARHYRFEPRPVAVARGNEKGRVERAIGYVRTAFFPARVWKDLDDLNRQALQWCHQEAADRLCPEDRRQTVQQAFEAERSLLLPLPETPYPVEERREVSIGKTPYARFDGNDYSVPHHFVQRLVTVWATLKCVNIVHGNDVVATHARSFDKGLTIECPEHIQALVERKRAAHQHRGMHRLSQVAPSSQELLIRMGKHGSALGHATGQLMKLLEIYGAKSLEQAIQEALKNNAAHPQAVRHLLEREAHERRETPLLPIVLPDDPRIRDLSVQHHSLTHYDTLMTAPPEAAEADATPITESGEATESPSPPFPFTPGDSLP